MAALMLAEVSIPRAQAKGARPSAPRIDTDDIGGMVVSSKGPEAGVWVVAETGDLPTRFVRIVVTDDQGRFVLPDLPKANYKVWVRGYGLVDSTPVTSAPGKTLNLTASLAPDARAAAQYYPAVYWYSLLEIPPKSNFPGTGSQGNGISPSIKDQGEWIDRVKTDGCESCHQLGDKATREIPPTLGHFPSSKEAWERRISVAQVGPQMNGNIARMGRDRALSLYADWTDRIARGEYPTEPPPRPQGLERNVVITEWDWGAPTEYFHDEIATDRRNPQVNGNGKVYGVHEVSSDFMSVLDPVRNEASQVRIPVRDPNTPYATSQEMDYPSPYWGNQAVWNSKANAHSLMMDAQGRVWTTSTIRGPELPAYCRKGSSLPSAQAFPMDADNPRSALAANNRRQASVYDPRTGQWTLLDLCFGTQHLMFAEDASNTLWFSNPGGDVVGWFNTRLYDETHDVEKAQGWTPLVLDTNGNGKRDEYVEPDQPVDPARDKRIRVGLYAVNVSPADGSVWGTVLGFPGAIVRLNPGSNPPVTALAELYEVPWHNPKAKAEGYSPRGMDIDRNGVAWVALASGQLASFDRRKCRGPLNGPAATGQHCPEGWTLYTVPGPNFKGNVEAAAADSNYYDWVDQFDSFGLGRNIPVATGNGSDALLALLPDSGQWVTLRVPYPMGFFAKSLDGRIDDPKAGWKGRGLWSTYATRALQHIEGGKGTTSKVVKFQLRPNPLAD